MTYQLGCGAILDRCRVPSWKLVGFFSAHRNLDGGGGKSGHWRGQLYVGFNVEL
jgi:hypothetical protein